MRPRYAFLLALPALFSCKGNRSNERIAFVSMRSDPPGVHVALAGGSKAARVSTSRAYIASPPVWAPDGSRLAYTVETAPDEWVIELYEIATATTTQVGKGMKLEDWSPDGAWLIATTVVDTDQLLKGKKPLRRSLQQLYAVAPDGGKKVKLSDGRGWDYSPAVSPDGTRVAFVSNRNDRVELRLVDVGGGGRKRLLRVESGDVLGSPAWSPDGSSLVFECTRGGAGAVPRLCRVPSSGGDVTELTATWAAAPAFSPDGKKIAFVAKSAEGTEQIFTMNADGSGPAPMTEEGRNTHPAWSPSGAHLAFVSDAGGDPEVMVMPSTGGRAVNVSSDIARDAFPAWQPTPAAAPAAAGAGPAS